MKVRTKAARFSRFLTQISGALLLSSLRSLLLGQIAEEFLITSKQDSPIQPARYLSKRVRNKQEIPMQPEFALLRYIGQAVLNFTGGGVLGEVLCQALPEIASHVWKWWRQEKQEQQRRAELEAIAQATATEVARQVATIVAQLAANQKVEVQQFLTCYLMQVPPTVRQSLRRHTDPTGTTIPSTLMLRESDDLLPLLPTTLPKFRVGDRPLPGVDWQLTELLGVGGFGEVWKAVNPHFDGIAPVALKFCLDPESQQRIRNFTHEGRVINQVMRHGKHAGIVELKHTYLQADPPCLEYEYIAGGELSQLIRRWHLKSGGPTPAEATKVMFRLAEIVGYAHRLQEPIVHRDLKPANILVQPLPNGGHQLKVADFGIGQVASHRAVRHATRMGTSREEFVKTSVRGAYSLLYASPEQQRGEAADPRDDVFSLGVIWYQLLVGDLGAGCPTGVRWQEPLKQRGMTPAILSLLVSCFETADHRPRDAAVLAERLKRNLRPERSQPPPLPAGPVVVAQVAQSTSGSQPVPTAQVVSSQTEGPSEKPNSGLKKKLVRYGGMSLIGTIALLLVKVVISMMSDEGRAKGAIPLESSPKPSSAYETKDGSGKEGNKEIVHPKQISLAGTTWRQRSPNSGEFWQFHPNGDWVVGIEVKDFLAQRRHGKYEIRNNTVYITTERSDYLSKRARNSTTAYQIEKANDSELVLRSNYTSYTFRRSHNQLRSEPLD